MAVSLDGRSWQDCCDEDDKTNFYLDDKKEEINMVQSHSFNDLVAARFVRIKVSTSLRWVGHDDKCFRFELLGCSEVSEARGNLSAVATSHGYISVTWSQPNISMLHSSDLILTSVNMFSVSVSQEWSGVMVEYNTSDHSIILPSPVYDQWYSVMLTCYYHNLPLSCGHRRIQATPQVSLSCLAHSSFCQDTERVVFQLPSTLTASYVGSGQVLIQWVNTRQGWVSQFIRIILKENYFTIA